MKRLIFRAAAALFAAALVFPAKADAVSAQKAILMDSATGRVIYEKDADSPSLIASTTKIMTALVVCEQCNVLDRVRIPKEAVGIEGSSMYLQEGEVLTVQELLYGLMLRSGNDAATALAIYCGGTVEGFAERMNDKAHSLGMSGTHFSNPHGLDDPQHYSTARDLAVLSAYAMDNPIFRQTVSTKQVTVGSRVLRNHNKLLWQIDGAEGVKTGFTKAAGRILVSSVNRNGRRLVCVTIHDPNDWDDHVQLMEMGFSEFHIQQLVSTGQILGVTEIVGGAAQRVSLYADADFQYPIAAGEKVEILIPGIGFSYAPVVQGAEAGIAQILVDGRGVGEVLLRYCATVEQRQEPKSSLLHRLFRGDIHERTPSKNTVSSWTVLPQNS